MRFWYSGVSSDRTVGIWFQSSSAYQFCAARPARSGRSVAGHRRVRVLRRPAAAARLGEQRFVVRLRGLERVGAHDRLARIVAVADSPRRRVRGGSLPIDRRRRWRRAASRQPMRAVAAEVARIPPERAVLVEVLRREEVDGQRLDAGRAAPFHAQPSSICTISPPSSRGATGATGRRRDRCRDTPRASRGPRGVSPGIARRAARRGRRS